MPQSRLSCKGKVGSHGNIGVHSRKKRRYICHLCGKTFTESKGTVFCRLRYPVEFVTQMITLLAYGCHVAAIVAALGVLYLPDSSRRWIPRTPAIAAGITDHIWTVQELFPHQVPLPPWEPPKRTGRPTNHAKELIKRWIL